MFNFLFRLFHAVMVAVAILSNQPLPPELRDK